MCLIRSLHIECDHPKKMDIVVSATGNHKCLVFNNVIEFTSNPIKRVFGEGKELEFRNTINLFIASDKIRQWVKFLHKTVYLKEAVFLFDINGVVWSVDGRNISNNLHISATTGSGYILELIFNEENMEVCS